MRPLAIIRRAQLRRAMALWAALTLGSGCEFGIPVSLDFDPRSGGGPPPIAPGAFFSFTSSERAVQVGDTLPILVMDAGGAVWTVSDTSIATITSDAVGGVLRPRRVGSVGLAVQAHGRTLRRDYEVVHTLCRRGAVTAPLVVGSDSLVTLTADDCALGYHPGFGEWPQDSLGPRYPTLRAEGRRLVLTDSTLLRVDASSAEVMPLLAIMESTDWSLTMRRNPWGRAFVARMLAPGSYVLWVAGEPDQLNASIRLETREVALCSDSTTTIRPLTLGSPAEGSLDASDCHSAFGFAQEWWRITLPRDGLYRVVIEPTSTPNNMSLQVFRRGGFLGVLPSFWAAGEYVVEASALSDVSYRIRVVACVSETICP